MADFQIQGGWNDKLFTDQPQESIWFIDGCKDVKGFSTNISENA